MIATSSEASIVILSAELMSILPAPVSILIASAPVPVELMTTLESVAPVTAIVRSSPAPSEATVKLAATPAESIDTPAPSTVTRPEAFTSKVAPSIWNVPSMSVLSKLDVPLMSTSPSISRDVASISPLALKVTPSPPATSKTIVSSVANLIWLSASRPKAKLVLMTDVMPV